MILLNSFRQGSVIFRASQQTSHVSICIYIVHPQLSESTGNCQSHRRQVEEKLYNAKNGCPGRLRNVGAVRTKPLCFPRSNVSPGIRRLGLLPGAKQLIFQGFIVERTKILDRIIAFNTYALNGTWKCLLYIGGAICSGSKDKPPSKFPFPFP